jgi:uncharacterized integral membrane protein
MSNFDQRDQKVENQTNIGIFTIPLPPRLIWTIAVALLILLSIALLTFINQNRAQIDYLLNPIQREQPDETLVLIATFDVAPGNADTRIHNEIATAIRREAVNLNLSGFRVEVEPTALRADARNKAETLGHHYTPALSSGAKTPALG